MSHVWHRVHSDGQETRWECENCGSPYFQFSGLDRFREPPVEDTLVARQLPKSQGNGAGGSFTCEQIIIFKVHET